MTSSRSALDSLQKGLRGLTGFATVPKIAPAKVWKRFAGDDHGADDTRSGRQVSFASEQRPDGCEVQLVRVPVELQYQVLLLAK